MTEIWEFVILVTMIFVSILLNYCQFSMLEKFHKESESRMDQMKTELTARIDRMNFELHTRLDQQ